MMLRHRIEAVERRRCGGMFPLCPSCRSLGPELWRSLLPEHRHSAPGCFTEGFLMRVFARPEDRQIAEMLDRRV
jgi:hypothetical protein